MAVISETFARQAWPGQSAIGRTVMQRLDAGEERALQIVGVARDAKYRYISSANAPFVYVPMAQQPQPSIEFYVRHAPGRDVAKEIRAAMAQVEPNVPIVMLQSFDAAAAIGLLPQKLAAWIAAASAPSYLSRGAGPVWTDGVLVGSGRARSRFAWR